MSPPKKVLDTILWVTLLGLKEKLWSNEAVTRIVSMQGTPINGHFTCETGRPMASNIINIVNDTFRFSFSTSILIEEEEDDKRQTISIHYHCIPPYVLAVIIVVVMGITMPTVQENNVATPWPPLPPFWGIVGQHSHRRLDPIL